MGILIQYSYEFVHMALIDVYVEAGNDSQYIPLRHTRTCTVYPNKYAHGFALLCFVVVIHWLIFPYPSGLLHWHCGNLTIALVPAKQPWWIWINTSCEFIMNDCITTTKQRTTKPCAYFLGYTVHVCGMPFVCLKVWSSFFLCKCRVVCNAVV